MVKKIVFCPGCHTDISLEMKHNEEVPVECPNCHRLGQIVFKPNLIELDFYPIEKPYTYVKITKNEENLEKIYSIFEPKLTNEENQIARFLIKIFERKLSVSDEDFSYENIRNIIPRKLKKNIDKFDKEKLQKIFYFVRRDTLGYGIIDPLMHDPNIEDISCDGSGVPLFISHRIFGSLKTNIKFEDEKKLCEFINILAQKCKKGISIANPMLDAVLPDGSRIQMTLGTEVTAKGSTFSIRKFRTDPYTPIDLLNFNTISAEMLVYFWLLVENGINALYAGSTASGKTTLLNAFSMFIPRDRKIVSIEETREINLTHPNWIPGVARSGSGESTSWELIGAIDMYDLLKAALRQRPEYIIVGEIRGEEANILFQAMTTGHTTYSTMHADSTQSLIHRLELEPIKIPRHMLQALDVISFQSMAKKNGKTVRRCKRVVEIIGIDEETKQVMINEVFRWDPSNDQFIFSGKSFVLQRICKERNISRKQLIQEMNRRIKLIKWMDINNIRNLEDVTKLINRYSSNPEDTLSKVKKLL